MVTSEPLRKAPRPKVIGGITVKVITGCGPFYIQMNWCRGKLFEVFATLGKTGGCAASQSEALTRSVTLGLRHVPSVPLSEYIRQFGGIRCLNPKPFPKEEAVLSCADALSKTLAKYGTLSIEEVIELILATNATEALTETTEEEQAKVNIAQLAKEREEQGL